MSDTAGGFAAVVSDMDGTILGPGHRLSARTKDTLRELLRRGVHVIFATGRHHDAVQATKRDLLEHLGVRHSATTEDNSCATSCEGFYIISSNGARVHNPAGELVYARDLDSDIVQKIYEHYSLRDCGDSANSGVSLLAYQTETWWTNRPFLSEEEMRTKYGTLPRVQPDILHHYPTKCVSKLSFRSNDTASLLQYESEINRMFPGRVTVVMTSNRGLDVMAIGVSKAEALRAISDTLGFDPQRDVIAFGNGMNDRDILASVAKGCIMQNGQERLKEALPHVEVILPNTEDGVARKLQEVFGIVDV